MGGCQEGALLIVIVDAGNAAIGIRIGTDHRKGQAGHEVGHISGVLGNIDHPHIGGIQALAGFLQHLAYKLRWGIVVPIHHGKDIHVEQRGLCTHLLRGGADALNNPVAKGNARLLLNDADILAAGQGICTG